MFTDALSSSTRGTGHSPGAAERAAAAILPPPPTVLNGSAGREPVQESLRKEHRVDELYATQLRTLTERVDHSFAVLLLFEYVVCVIGAFWMTPNTWQGTRSSLHLHVWGAIVLGAIITSLPAYLARYRSGEVFTRHAVAIGQMLMSGLLIHVTGGRIETHFHIFGSLAFLAFYRDWRVLITASMVVATDHFVRGVFWPESVFGAVGANAWRWLEHTAWVVFEDVFLILSIGQSLRMLRDNAERGAELEEAKDVAEEASRAKDDFIAVLSHELRTPLTPSLAMLSAMADDEQLNHETRDAIRMVRRNVELEARLIDDLLDLTRIARGKIQLIPGTVDLHASLEHILRTFQSDFVAQRLTVTHSFRAKQHWAYGDAARLQQVFWNVLKNAVKFTPDGGWIEVRTQDSDGRISVEIRDSGKGIPEELMPRLFQAFQQGGPAVTKRFGGLGLGLAISKTIVAMHDGDIRAVSEGPGKGAAFIIDLPATAEPATVEAPLATTASTQEQPRRILLVDDHTDTRQTLAKLLSRAGYEVTTAESVGSALQKAMASRFDLLISDIGLPDGTGRDLMSVLHTRFGLRGIAFSGYGMEGDVQKSLDAGFLAHLTKPVDFARLREELGRALEPADSDSPGTSAAA